MNLFKNLFFSTCFHSLKKYCTKKNYPGQTFFFSPSTIEVINTGQRITCSRLRTGMTRFWPPRASIRNVARGSAALLAFWSRLRGNWVSPDELQDEFPHHCSAVMRATPDREAGPASHVALACRPRSVSYAGDRSRVSQLGRFHS